MKKLVTKAAIILAGISGVATAQQDPQYTMWMHNRLIYNPGYAGTHGGMCGNLQYRKQWSSFDGAPTTINFAGDMMLPGAPVGVGLIFMNDKIGPMSTNFIRGAISYLIPAGNTGGKFGIGVDLGVLQKSISNTWITPEDKIDPNIPGTYSLGANPELNKMTYDVGFGAFYNLPNTFYAGLSSTHLPAQSVGTGSINYDLTRHYYVMAGYYIKPNPMHWFIPNIKYKSDLAAGALDVNLTYMWDQKIWGGASYRMNDAAAVMAGVNWPLPQAKGVMNVKGGVAYDFVLSKLKGYTSGSFELFLGVCYTPKPKTATTTETDRFY